MSERSRVRRRWRVAHFLNRFRRYCWCDLVDWAIEMRKTDPGEHHHMLRPTENFPTPFLFSKNTRGCADDATMHGNCYCAKFRTAEMAAACDLRKGFAVPSPKRETP